MKVYLAAPFFNPTQVAIVDRIEKLLDELAIPYYSPRRDGTLQDLSADDRRRLAPTIFANNVMNIQLADLIVAVIDDRDTGVAWEMGFAYAGRPKQYIVSYTEAGYGVNVMVQRCVDGHVRGIDELRDILTNLNFADYKNFDERITT